MDTIIHPIISPDHVRQLMNEQDVVIVDARGGADAFERYRAGHLEKAIFMDLDRDLSERAHDAAQGGRHPLPTPAAFGSLLGQSGITPASRVLVYDDKSGANAAARFWWMMKAAGHNKVQVVDGGWDGLARAGLSVTTGPGTAVTPAAPYPIRNWILPTANIETVDQLRKDSDYVVIDVRENYRYRGESEPIDLLAGHIPGAVNLPYLENLAADGRFLSADALTQKYRSVIGNREGKQVVIHCGSGVTACHTLLALEVARIPGARLYVGSWSEWSRNGKPIAKG